MSTRLTYTMRYDGATIDQVFTMLADPAFREQVCSDQGNLRSDVSITPAGQGMTVRIEQVRATEGLPSIATKVVGAETTLIQSEQWSSPTEATLELEIPGKPGDVRGTVKITEVNGGVDEVVTFDIKVGIPLIGGKLETMLKGLVEKSLKYENRTGVAWLAKS